LGIVWGQIILSPPATLLAELAEPPDPLYSAIGNHQNVLSRISFEISLVRESIAYPYMDFQKSTVINMDIHAFGYQSSIIYARVDIHIDIQSGISMRGHSTMDIRVFMDISL